MLVGTASGARRRFKVFAVQSLAAALGACGVSDNMLPAENATSTTFASYEAVETAYDKVKVGETNENELAQAGFDIKTEPNIERLSYLTIMARFMPDPHITFEHLPPAIQTCINAQDRCSAVVFHPTKLHAQRTGGVVPDFLAFERVSVNTGWSAEVIFLMQDGTVVYKVLQGKPNAQETTDLVQPLGPAQNLGNLVVRVGKGLGKY